MKEQKIKKYLRSLSVKCAEGCLVGRFVELRALFLACLTIIGRVKLFVNKGQTRMKTYLNCRSLHVQ